MDCRKNSILLFELNKENDSEYDLKLYRNQDKYKMDYFEKLKPNTKINKKENEKSLKGAENQVKKILSNFMRTYELEANEYDNGNNQINDLKKISSIDKNSIKKKKIKKIRTVEFRKRKNENSNKTNIDYSIGNENIKNNNTPNSPGFSDKKVKKLNSNESRKSKYYSPKILKKVKYFKDDKNNEIHHLRMRLDGNKKIIKVKRFYSWKIRKISKNYSNSINFYELNNKSPVKKTKTQKRIKNYISFREEEIISNHNKKNEKRKNELLPNKNSDNNKTNNNKLLIPEKELIYPYLKKSNLYQGNHMLEYNRYDIKSESDYANLISNKNNKYNKMTSGIKKIIQQFPHSNTMGCSHHAQNQTLGNGSKKKLINTIKDIKPLIIKKQTKKSSSSNEEYSFHSLKRKSIMICEKYRKLLHKGALYDSLDDEEFEDEEDINKYYIDPNSYFCFCFDSISFIFNIFTFVEIPFYLAMNLNFCRTNKFSFHDIVNIFNEIINILDFLFGFFLAFYNMEEQLIKKNNKIIKKYLLGWCLFDLISAIPFYSLIKVFEPICNNNSNSLYYNYVLDNSYHLFICNRILKIIKIFIKNQSWKYISNKLTYFWNVTINICLIIFAINYTACLYIFIARNSYPNWILKAGLEINEFEKIYICAIYVLIVTLTTVGYGDITCCSLKERIFQVFLLIIGIIAYSWLISSFSNLVQKINEKSVDYEKKKSILDEIKFNNPNLSDSLYGKILKYLKFRHYHEKNLKSNIFDCLPVGLKNNLIYEMYKPIIKNFIFFKNFQNTDFIVQVITCFKPILAYKNYMLVNEGDLIEDIIFVKHGVLSVELSLNVTNPQENIDKYLTNNKSEKSKDKLKNKLSSNKHDTLSSFVGETSKNLNSLIYNSGINSSFKCRSSVFGRTTLINLKPMKDEKVNVKVLCIRDNEHFGDVLMFLEERSPLQVRVRSKKCELFFLKKIDALKISTSYPHIWKRINKKSVYNFKQIKKYIKKIVEIYCSVKGDIGKNSKNEDGFVGEFGLKKSEKWIHPKNNDLNNSALNSINKYINEDINYSEREIGIRTNNFFLKKYGLDGNNLNDNKNKIFSEKRCHSFKLKNIDFESLFFPKNHLSFSDSSSSFDMRQEKKQKKKIRNRNSLKEELSTKILDVFNNNYTYYKNIKKQNKGPPISIIAEETDKDFCISKIKDNVNNDSIYKNSINSKNKMLENGSINSTIKRETKSEPKRKNINQKEKKSLFTLSNVNYNNNYRKIKNSEILENSSEEYNSPIYYDSTINNEIYPGETLEINNEENLLNKKLNKNDNKKYDIKNFYNINFNIEQNKKSNKIDKLLKYFEEENKFQPKKVSQKESLCNKSSKHLSIRINNSNKAILHPEIESSNDTSKNDLYTHLKTIFFDNTLFSINNNISFMINSSYDNYNKISGEKLIKSKNLQNKLKEFLIKETFNVSNGDNKNTGNHIINKNKTSEPLKNQNKGSIKINFNKKKLTSSIVHNTTKINYINNIPFLKNNIKKPQKSISTEEVKKIISVDTNTEKKSKDYNKIFQRNINQFRNKFSIKKSSKSFVNTPKYTNHLNIYHNKSLNSFDISKDFNLQTRKVVTRRAKTKRKNSFIISSSKARKRKDSLLTLIGYNIKTTNQQLNDPDVFYNNYFNNILKEEMKEKNKKKY